MTISDSIEEMHLYSTTPFGDHSVRFVRVADNNVLLIVDANIIALLNMEDQRRLHRWLMRRVQEAQ